MKTILMYSSLLLIGGASGVLIGMTINLDVKQSERKHIRVETSLHHQFRINEYTNKATHHEGCEECKIMNWSLNADND